MDILGIDPGTLESAYVLTNNNLEIESFGKLENSEMLKILITTLKENENLKVAIEMIASMGMAVGQSVFETCRWIGRFEQKCLDFSVIPTIIYRKDEKINLCGSMRAKDSNIRQALIDRFAKFDKLNGKGSKKNPDVFFGFKADMWAAMAVTVTYYDLYLKYLNI